MCIGNHTYKIGLIYKKLELRSRRSGVCIYMWKKRGGGGGGGRTTYRVGNLI